MDPQEKIYRFHFLMMNVFKSMNSQITVPKRKTMKELLMSEFSTMCENLKRILLNNKSKFSFTTDCWTAQNGTSHFGVTIHFIDDNWIFQSLALDLVASEGKHSGKDIAKKFYECLKYYGIQKKVQGITVDNASANTTFMHELSLLFQKDDLNLKENQHFRCLAHVINLGVRYVRLLRRGQRRRRFLRCLR